MTVRRAVTHNSLGSVGATRDISYSASRWATWPTAKAWTIRHENPQHGAPCFEPRHLECEGFRFRSTLQFRDPIHGSAEVTLTRHLEMRRSELDV